MKNSVKITANPKTGQVFTQTRNLDGTPHLDKNGKEHGFIRVESKKVNLGFAYSGAVKTRSALIAMSLEAYNAAKDELAAGTQVDGKIIRIDSLTQAYPSQKPVQWASKDEKGNIIEGKMETLTSGGQPVYRSEKFTDKLSDSDVILSYDKAEVEEVSAVSAKADTVIAG